MKTLELENYGVMEMNHAEMVETDGGGFWEGLLLAIGIGLVVAGMVWAFLAAGGGGGGEGPTQGPNNM